MNIFIIPWVGGGAPFSWLDSPWLSVSEFSCSWARDSLGLRLVLPCNDNNVMQSMPMPLNEASYLACFEWLLFFLGHGVPPRPGNGFNVFPSLVVAMATAIELGFDVMHEVEERGRVGLALGAFFVFRPQPQVPFSDQIFNDVIIVRNHGHGHGHCGFFVSLSSAESKVWVPPTPAVDDSKILLLHR